MTPPPRTVVVGVVPTSPQRSSPPPHRSRGGFDAEIVCAAVDVSRYGVGEDADGRVIAWPVDADLADEQVEEFDPALRDSIAAILDPLGVRWSTRALAGGAAQELSRLAEQLDAAMIVVGTRERGMRGSLHEFFSGSVAVQLAHRQHRPVLVIPLEPAGAGLELPWDGGTATGGGTGRAASDGAAS
jgi:nucleotide-binding universal stress UspA family protein